MIASTKGETGEVPVVKESANHAGIYFTTEGGGKFTEPEGTCITKAPVEGSLAGEPEPLDVAQATGTLKFKGAAGVQSIKKIATKTGGHTPSLKAFNIVGISENTTEAITFARAVELS